MGNRLANMKFLLALSSTLATATAFVAPQADRTVSTLNAGKDDLVALAEKANPIVKFYDPIGLGDQEFYSWDNDRTIGFLRHAEIKHGRIAMFAFVGYCVQSNWHFPWAQSLAGDMFPSTDLGPEAQWDDFPVEGKQQIFAVIAAMELWDECGGGGALDHYTRGRQPGKYPPFENFRKDVHFVFDLYDPFGLNKKMKDEVKERRLVAEINNGRLAMLGIFSFLCADTIPGSVPALANIAIPYEGNVMVPFEGQFSFF